jgi:ubiquinone/menaquinone biosynthesis C-methylase UbiE
MENKKKLLQKDVLEPKQLYFELQSSWGITKHIGGFKATEKLIELCHINKGKYVLEVGCGVGITACYIAQEYGGRVVGVDISERMVKISTERARRKNVEDKVKFITADAQNLPFEDELFDAVICESVNVFVKDKLKALREYIRVIKPNGYVGINEVIWIKEPTKELDEYI